MQTAAPPSANRADRPLGMRRSELEILADLARGDGISQILEIGMAHASSTLAMLGALSEKGSGHVVSIDPFQFEDAPGAEPGSGTRGQGVLNVEAAGLAHMHTCIAEPDYVALPRLAKEGALFDLILIDGYHSFESTLLDFVYADMLLRIGGTCVFHDTAFPAVHKAVRYLMTNTAYELIGPRPEPMYDSLLPKAWRRVRYFLRGDRGSFEERRTRWCSLAAFTKAAARKAPELTLNDF
jgi:predicted O-methyltransferase YrrM